VIKLGMSKRILIKLAFSVTLAIAATSLIPTPARAYEDAVEYKSGQTISVGGCIPENTKPPVQVYNFTSGKLIMTIGTKTSWGGPSPKRSDKWCTGGVFIQRWIAAKFKGDFELAIYIPKTKKYFEATPAKLVEIKPYKGNPDDPYLDQPAVNFFPYSPGQSTLVNVMEVNLGTSESPASFRSVIDQIYVYLGKRYNTKITANDIDVLFSPGGWGNNMLREQIMDPLKSWGVLMRRLKANAG
jgi:hypothetical protein